MKTKTKIHKVLSDERFTRVQSIYRILTSGDADAVKYIRMLQQIPIYDNAGLTIGACLGLGRLLSVLPEDITRTHIHEVQRWILMDLHNLVDMRLLTEKEVLKIYRAVIDMFDFPVTEMSVRSVFNGYRINFTIHSDRCGTGFLATVPVVE